MDVALLDPEAHHRLEEEQQTMRVVVVLGETSLICAVLYFAAIGYILSIESRPQVLIKGFV